MTSEPSISCTFLRWSRGNITDQRPRACCRKSEVNQSIIGHYSLYSNTPHSTVSFTNVEHSKSLLSFQKAVYVLSFDFLAPSNAGPTRPPTRDALVESAIWSLDVKTHKLTGICEWNLAWNHFSSFYPLAQWVNADGSTPTTVLAYDIREVTTITNRFIWNANHLTQFT